MSRRRKLYKKTVIKAIQGSRGIISIIAKRCGVEWHTIDKYIKTDEKIREAYDSECSMISDIAEGVIMESLQNKDVKTAMWYLENKARDRGYGTPLPNITKKDESIILNFIDSEGAYETES